MPANYMHRIIDKIGKTGTLRKAIDVIYDHDLGIAEEVVYDSDIPFNYLPVPAEEMNKLYPEGYVVGVNTAIWIDPDLDIGFRAGFDPDVVILDTGITYRVDTNDELSILNHGYKTVKLIKIESDLT